MDSGAFEAELLKPSGALLGRHPDFGEQEVYRWLLWRHPEVKSLEELFALRMVTLLMLNPSTADGVKDDATIRKVRAFVQSWGFDGFWVVNLFAWRATNPKELKGKSSALVIGAGNDEYIKMFCKRSALVVAAWGKDGSLYGRGRTVQRMLHGEGVQLHFLKLTNEGEPYHPLYLEGTLKPQPLSFYG